jgi:hypothetical protein
MPAGVDEIYKSIRFDLDGVPFSKWPKLSCSAANELTLATPLMPDEPNPGDARLAIAGELKLKTGVAVNQFSSNGTLVGNSDLTVPTEKAVKTYIDTQISQINSALSVKAALAGDASQDFQTKNLTVNGDLIAKSNVRIGTDLAQSTLTVSGSNVTVGTPAKPANLTVSSGAIIPAAGNSESAGILFPKNSGGGSGDAAWLRYYARTGEATTFEIGTSNDGNDHIALIASGNVGIGTIEPQGKLDVRGDIRAGNSDIYFTKTDHEHTGIGNITGYAAIENSAAYEALMILGRAGTAKGRSVKLWDYLQVNGDLDVTGNITGRVAGIGIAVTNALVHGSSIPIPSGFTKQECVFFAFIKSVLDVKAIPFNCFVADGVVQIVREAIGNNRTPIKDLIIFATGIAIAKKGGW